MQNEIENRTLTRNGISKFILRFDFITPDCVDFINLINTVSHEFDRTEKIVKTHHKIDLSSDQVEKSQYYEYVLVNEQFKYSIKFSDLEKSFLFETNQYVSYKTYIDAFMIIKDALLKTYPKVQSKRIGMRFINVFHSPYLKNANKVFNNQISRIIINTVSHENTSRVIIQEEYNLQMSKMRVQYGIPNKFYPSQINNYDFLFDIDSYDDSVHDIESWERVISDLNHNAYNKFIEFINPQYIKELK
jgi:uncharacterized protein (TIGR04255 family)